MYIHSLIPQLQILCEICLLTILRTSRRILKKQNPPPPFRAKSATLPSSPSSGQRKVKSPKKASPPAKKKEKVASPPTKKKKKKEESGSPKSSPPLKKKEDGTRRSSISKIHEKLRRHLSRKGKDSSPTVKERPSAQYWSSAPRLKNLEVSGDPSTLTCLARSSSMRHGPPKTVSAQFQASLISLMERLEQTNPFFVRCIKSNGEKVNIYTCLWFLE